MSNSKSIIRFLAVTLLIGCAPPQTTQKLASSSRNPNLITEAEIASVVGTAENAYDVIRRLRPAFLHTRGVSTMGQSAEPTLVVYMDMVKVGGVSGLRRLSARLIRSIQYLNGMDATTRFGTDHGAGAILISTRGPVE